MVESFFTDVSFNVFESEILGIAGVEGNGQKEVVESIIGINDNIFQLLSFVFIIF